jgi:hypothetical protein
VTNLAAGDSVRLQNNGGHTLTVTANGAFTFATKLASGSGGRQETTDLLTRRVIA